MIFNSITFLVFLAIVLPLYWVLADRNRQALLFVSSLVFYGFWRWEFVPVMMVSVFIDYFAALRIEATDCHRRRKAYLALSLCGNLGLLFFFKYLHFAETTLNSCIEMVSSLTGNTSLSEWARSGGFSVPFHIILPLGISFYTFQTISYTVDVYRRSIRAERSFVLFATYVTFFPQLVAGPILRAVEVVDQLRLRPPFDLELFGIGLRRILMGLFLKVALADQIAPLVEDIFVIDPKNMFAFDVWTGAFLFGFQIYFDFSAYSHVAIGVAYLMGIRFPENFCFPYMAISPRDFWRRWHISLSSWVRDYLYLPLMGAKFQTRSEGGLGIAGAASEKRSIAAGTPALLLTWAIMGLWHGAGWNFLFWGLYQGLWITAYRIVASRYDIEKATGWRRVMAWMFTLPAMMLGWIFFRAASLADSLSLLGTILHPTRYLHLGLRENTYLITALLLVGMVVIYGVRQLAPKVKTRSILLYSATEFAALTCMATLTFIFLRPMNQFIYFQF